MGRLVAGQEKAGSEAWSSVGALAVALFRIDVLAPLVGVFPPEYLTDVYLCLGPLPAAEKALVSAYEKLPDTPPSTWSARLHSKLELRNRWRRQP